MADAKTCDGCRRWTPGAASWLGECGLSLGVPWAAYEAACDDYEADGSTPPIDLVQQSVRLPLHAVRTDAAPAAPAATQADAYVIECTEHPGELALFWRPNRAGYTTRLDEAGRYTRQKAEAQARSRSIDPCLSG